MVNGYHVYKDAFGQCVLNGNNRLVLKEGTQLAGIQHHGRNGAGIGQHQDGEFVAEPQVRGHLPEALRDHGGTEIWCKCLFQLLQQC